MRDVILAAITTTADYMARWNLYPSDEADEWLTAALKTEEYYYRVLWKAVRDAYSGMLTGYEFETIMLNQISSQFRRGFNSGLREMGLSPANMPLSWETELQNTMAQELTYVQKLMDDIVKAARIDGGYEQFKSRIEMWAHRFEEMKSLAMMRAAEVTGDYLEWVLGVAEHCTDCLYYASLGARPASFWVSVQTTTGHRPQSRTLECHGYNCQCGMRKAEAPQTFGTDMLFAPALNR